MASSCTHVEITQTPSGAAFQAADSLLPASSKRAGKGRLAARIGCPTRLSNLIKVTGFSNHEFYRSLPSTRSLALWTGLGRARSRGSHLPQPPFRRSFSAVCSAMRQLGIGGRLAASHRTIASDAPAVRISSFYIRYKASRCSWYPPRNIFGRRSTQPKFAIKGARFVPLSVGRICLLAEKAIDENRWAG